MQEISYLSTEEPKEQHQGEGELVEYCDEILFQFFSYLLSNHREICWSSRILDYLQVL